MLSNLLYHPPACLLRLRESNIWFVGKQNPQKFVQSITLSCNSGMEDTPPFLPSKKKTGCPTFVRCRCIVHHCTWTGLNSKGNIWQKMITLVSSWSRPLLSQAMMTNLLNRWWAWSVWPLTSRPRCCTCRPAPRRSQLRSRLRLEWYRFQGALL